MHTNAQSIFDLSPPEKLQLVEDLWDDLAAVPAEVPIHEWQLDELERRPGLGIEFPGCIDAAVPAITRQPELHVKVKPDYCRYLVRRFPYAIFYQYLNNAVTVYSVFHTARDPQKWRSRLK